MIPTMSPILHSRGARVVVVLAAMLVPAALLGPDSVWSYVSLLIGWLLLVTAERIHGHV